MNSISTIFKYYWKDVRKYGFWHIFGIFAFGIGQVLGGVVVPIIYKNIIDMVAMGNTAISGPELFRPLFYLGGIIILYNIAYRAFDFSYIYSSANIMREVSRTAFNNLTRHSYNFFINEFGGRLVARANRYVSAFETLSDIIVFNFWSQSLVLIGMFIVLGLNSLLLAALFFVWFILYIIATFFLVKYKWPRDIAAAAANSKTTGQLSDVIANVLNLKMFSSRIREKNIYGAVTQEEYVARRRAWNFNIVIWCTQAAFLGVLEVLSMWLVITLWLEGSVSAGMVVLVQIYVAGIFDALWNLGRSITRFSSALSDAQEMVDIFEQPIEVQDSLNPEPVRIDRGEILFEDVSFTYDSSDHVFKNFNLKIKSGEKVGIVGKSGAGKTTITKLLLRFTDIHGGTISIDGQDISRITQDDLRKNIAYVPQEPVLFHRTLKENIAYGNPDASDKEIMDAAKHAHANEFIAECPDGYETYVGERGVKLSGGERQRVAIARAMLKAAPILILDEATSSLDSVSENLIQKGFDSLMEDKTVIVIAHRLSTVQKMDRIIVLGEGTILEEGTHKDLIQKKGAYYTFWKQQQDSFIT